MQLVLTLVLVAGGIFVYDALGARTAPDAPPETIRDEEPPAAPVEPEPAPFAILEGRGDDIWRAEVERRLALLETVPTADTTTSPEGVEAGVPGVPGRSPDETQGEEGDAAEGEAPRRRRFTPEDVATFRALLETVERQRRVEKTRRQMLDGLKKIGVELDKEQANQVVDLTLRLYRGFQQETRGMPQGEAGRDQRLQVYDRLKQGYADELYRTIPASDADRILEAIEAQARGRQQQR